MNYQIVGIQQKRGEYEGRMYNNTLLHALCANVNVIGEQASTIKMKTEVFQNILRDCKCTPDALVGRKADITFDRYGNLEYFDLLPADEK